MQAIPDVDHGHQHHPKFHSGHRGIWTAFCERLTFPFFVFYFEWQGFSKRASVSSANLSLLISTGPLGTETHLSGRHALQRRNSFDLAVITRNIWADDVCFVLLVWIYALLETRRAHAWDYGRHLECRLLSLMPLRRLEARRALRSGQLQTADTAWG